MAADTEIPLKERLQQDMKAALRAGEKSRLSTLRLALAAIQQREVDSRETLDDAGILQVLEKMVKQRREAIEQFRKGARDDLVAKENAEIAVLEGYLPEPLSGAETTALIDTVIDELAASSPKDMGRVMAEIKRRAGGRVDLAGVSQQVRARLQSS